jgi:luciferase family oxidoreductase group 1
MLPNHAPWVVAEQFGTLEALHPGRIDLGIGRAPGTDPITARALRRTDDLAAERFPDDLVELIGYFTGASAQLAVPGRGLLPEIWLLGSSTFSAQLAGLLGVPFSFAHHFSPRYTEPALDTYRESFRPSAVLDAPRTMVAVAVICAPTDEEARWLSGPSALSMVLLRTGRLRTLPTEEEAEAYPWTESERALAASISADHVIGSPETVRRGLAELAARTGADELMVSTRVHGFEARRRSLELLAGVWDPAGG